MPVHKGETIVTEFKPDYKELSGGFRAVERQTSEHLRKIEGLYRNAQGKLSAGTASGGGGILDMLSGGLKLLPGLGTLASGITAVAGALKGTIQIGFDYRRMLEENTIAFEVMLGSADDASKHLKDLARFAETSPFEFPELVGTSKRMLAMGFSIKEIIPSLRAVSDAAAALGSDIDGITLALGQMRQKGRLQAEEMNQLVERGIPAWEILSKAIGKTVEETRKLSEQGKISGRGAAQAILIGMKERYGGLGERFARETATGLEANINDVLARLLGTASGPFFDRYKKILGGTLEVMNSETVAALSRVVAKGGGVGFGLLDKGLSVGMEASGANAKLGILKGLVGAGVSAAEMFLDEFEGPKGTQAKSPAKAFIPIGARAAEGFKIGFTAEMNVGGGIMGLFGQVGGGDLRRIAQHPNVRAFFDTIARAEGGELNIMAGGRRVMSGAKHPGEVVPMSQWFRGDRGPSSAAGLYQITRTNWRNLAPQLGLTNFSDPEQQMLAALKLFSDRKGGAGLQALLSGDFEKAMQVAALDWTSTPGSRIGGGKQWGKKRWLGVLHSELSEEGGGYSAPGGFAGGAAGGIAGSARPPVPVVIVGERGGRIARRGRRASAAAGSPDEFRPGQIEGFGDISADEMALNEGMKMLADTSGVFGSNLKDSGVYMEGIGDVGQSEIVPFMMTFAALMREVTEGAEGLNGTIEQTEPILIKVRQAANVFGITAEGAAQAFEGAWTSTFTNVEGGFKGMMVNFVLTFAQALNQMVQQWAASQLSSIFGALFKSVLGGMAGGISGGALTTTGTSLSGSFASGFAGGFQHGGFIPPGKYGSVHEGERVYAGRSGATVVPAVARKVVSLTVNFNGQGATPQARQSQAQVARQLADMLTHELERGG